MLIRTGNSRGFVKPDRWVVSPVAYCISVNMGPENLHLNKFSGDTDPAVQRVHFEKHSLFPVPKNDRVQDLS